MKPSGSHEELPFLEPPHRHDVTNISHLASIPTSMLSQLPKEIQDSLWGLQESTSVVYASYIRLQELLSERLDRLGPLPGTSSYSEGTFFTYTSQLKAERSYLLEECVPDWKHKLLHLDFAPYYGLPITHLGQSMTIRGWYERLISTVQSWANEARTTAVPDFEETVSERQSQATSPISEGNDDSMDMVTYGINKPVSAERKGQLGPSRYKTGIGREIEITIGVKKADS